MEGVSGEMVVLVVLSGWNHVLEGRVVETLLIEVELDSFVFNDGKGPRSFEGPAEWKS